MGGARVGLMAEVGPRNGKGGQCFGMEMEKWKAPGWRPIGKSCSSRQQRAFGELGAKKERVVVNERQQQEPQFDQLVRKQDRYCLRRTQNERSRASNTESNIFLI